MVIPYACISRRSWAVFCCSHQGKCGVMGRQWIKRRGSASVRRRDTSPRYQRTEHMAWIWMCEGLWGGVHKLTPEPSTSPAGRSFDLIAEKYHLTQESLINVGQIAAVFTWAMLGGVHVSCCPGVPDRPEGSSENFVIELQICAAMRNFAYLCCHCFTCLIGSVAEWQRVGTVRDEPFLWGFWLNVWVGLEVKR